MIDWAPFTRPLALVVAITSENMRLNFPTGRFTVTKPVVQVTVSGAPTNVTIDSMAEHVSGIGEVHTGVDLTFPSSAIGKQAHIWVAGA